MWEEYLGEERATAPLGVRTAFVVAGVEKVNRTPSRYSTYVDVCGPSTLGCIGCLGVFYSTPRFFETNVVAEVRRVSRYVSSC